VLSLAVRGWKQIFIFIMHPLAEGAKDTPSPAKYNRTRPANYQEKMWDTKINNIDAKIKDIMANSQ